MIASARPDSFEISDYVGVLRRRWRMIVSLVFLCTLAAAAYIVVAPKVYTATSTVYVTPDAANVAALLGNKTNTVVNMDNEVQIVMSTSVARLAAAQLRTTVAPTALAKQVSVTVPANTQILQISCSASSPRGASACAQAFATSYLQARESQARTKIQTEVQAEQAKEKALLARSIALQAQLKKLKSGSAAAVATHAALENVATQLAPLRATVASLLASTNTRAGSIISAAQRPGSPSSPKKLLVGPSGVMVGLLIGLILAFWADRRDDRIHAAADVERFLDIPVLLGLIQRPPGNALVPARSPTGEAFADLARATATALGEGNHIVLVVGASAGTGTSVVAANLAATLARIRADVVLVCASPRGSLSPKLLGTSPGDGRGLAELIAGTAAVSDVARQCAVGRLGVVLPGIDQGTGYDLQYDASRRAMVALRDSARYVVIDAGAATDGGALDLAEFADAGIVVAELDATTRAEVANCVRRLDRIKTEVLGAAVLPHGRWSRAAAKDASRASFPADQARPARADHAQQRSAGGGKRRADGAPPAARVGERQPPAATDRQPYGTGSMLQDFGPQPRYGPPGEKSQASEPRGAGQTWPLPRVSRPDANAEPGARPATDYPADYPATKGKGDS